MDKPISAYQGDGPYVFVCYAHEDKELVYPEIRRLQDQGINVWWDEGISPGSEWSDALADAIEGCANFVYLITPRSVATENCRRELNHAVAENRQLLAVYLEETDVPGGIRLHLHNRQAILKYDLDPDAYNRRVLDTLKSNTATDNTRHRGSGEIAEHANSAAGVQSSERPRPRPPVLTISVLTIVVAIAGALAIWVTRDWVTRDSPPHQSESGEVASRDAGSSGSDSIRELLDKPMVAVLPFTNATGNPDHDYVGVGVMDEIIVGLQRFRSFPVVSRGSTIAIRDRTEPLLDIARELGAEYIVDGSVRRDGEGFRTLATMTDASGTQVWARSFDLDADLRGVFPMVDELAATVAGAVRDTEIERLTIVNRPPIGAWEHYVKGLTIAENWAPARHAEGMQHIERALEIAPDMAEAWWALGELESGRLSMQPTVDPETVEEMIGYFRKAHELNPFYGAACGCLGYWLAVVGRDREARVVFEQAMEANPLSGSLRVDYAQYLAWDGRYDEAIEMAEVSTKLGIRTLERSQAFAIQATALYAMNLPDKALIAVERSLLAKRIDSWSTPMAIAVLYVTGDHDSAAALFHEFDERFPTYSPSNLITRFSFKPIDDSLARDAPAGSPQNTADIFRILAATASNGNAQL